MNKKAAELRNPAIGRFLGVDTGGTFTDFVYLDGKALRVHKVLSTPDFPELAILQGIEEMALPLDGLVCVHGSTVATNALLERKGVRTAYITNRGFADVLTIGRQARKELYNLQPEPIPPPVPNELCLETGGRLAADGSQLEPLSESELGEIRQSILDLKPDAVAINLLYSFLDDRFEKRIADSIPSEIYISRSSAVLSEYKEYERGIATWLNAYVGPLMQRYLSHLVEKLEPASLAVMQSHGGTMTAEEAGNHAVQLLLSGPAGGLVGAQYQGRAAGYSKIMSFDMGGTSTDVALINDDIELTTESELAGYPVAIPMVDMHTIGAGGGSIAWLDDGGMLQVGPQSAGADPGPACYGKGGNAATVTDANLFRGHLPVDTALGGNLKLDDAAAKLAIAKLAHQSGLSIEQMAQGIVDIANEHMAQALRVISVQRGYDPKEYTLMSFGGSGGLHVCALAEQLGMKKALVPAHAGVLSALGMVVANPAKEQSISFVELFENLDLNTLVNKFLELELKLKNKFNQEENPVLTRRLDLRYQGQSSTISVKWKNDLDLLQKSFHQQHEKLFGHQLGIKIELVNLRVRASIDKLAIKLPKIHNEKKNSETFNPSTMVLQRDNLIMGEKIKGPAIIIESVSTTFVAENWIAEADSTGNIVLTSE